MSHFQNDDDNKVNKEMWDSAQHFDVILFLTAATEYQEPSLETHRRAFRRRSQSALKAL